MRRACPQLLADTPQEYAAETYRPRMCEHPGPKRGREDQPKINPGDLVVAAEKRSCTSAQLTTFQNALT
jgi:hypothetical protein